MFACRWFEVAVLVSSVAKTAHTSVGQEVPSEFSPDISQADVELILNAQTNLRRHLIRSLAEVRGRITEVEGLDAVVGGIIQDLQRRNLDPFKLLRYANSSQEQSPTSLTAEVINNLQIAAYGPVAADRSPLFQITGRPDILLRPELLQKVQELSEPLVPFVLRGIHKNSIKANSKLLSDVLYNFRFREYSPELSVILESVNQTLSENVENLLDFHADAALAKRPEDVLSDILKFISRNKQSDARLLHLTDQLLSALSDGGSAVQAKDTSELSGLFDLMLQDDYPLDVIQAKSTLSLAIRNNKAGVDLSGVNENIKGNPPMEKLLMLMAELRGSSSFQREVRAVHPHIKLRYLTSKGQFFHPRTAADVTFLLNSFLTIHHEMSPTVVEEVERIFVFSDWEEILKDFDFSRYSKPRPLVVDMIQGLLDESGKLPLCSRIILRYFLSNNRQDSRCASDVFREEWTGPSAHGSRRAQDGPPPLAAIPDLPVTSLFRSEWEASRSTPKRSSAAAPQSSSSRAVTTPSSALSKISPSLISQRPPDSEGPVISNELSSSVSLPAWPSTYGATATILPLSHSASSRHHPQLPAYSGTSTTPMLPHTQPRPSVAAAVPDSPTTSPSPSPPGPCTSSESSTSAHSQSHPSTVRSTSAVAKTFLPARRFDDTTPIDSIDQGSSSTTEIQRHSSTARLSTNSNSMAQDETTSKSVTTRQEEKTQQSGVELTSDEYLTPETRATTVNSGESTSSRPPREAGSKAENSGATF